jgi:predicted molibdopterin-dependent oxidoreductase YjgC
MNITIDGKVCEAEYGEYILDIAKRNNIHIPSLCHSDALPGQASCRVCIVDIVEKGWHKTVTREQLAYINNRLGRESEKQLCEVCKKSLIPGKLKAINGNVVSK